VPYSPAFPRCPLEAGLFLWEPCMRRLTGIYDGVEHIILEYDHGMVECPALMRDLLAQDDGSMPTGPALDQACRRLFGDTFQAGEV
jgi:hypothetical protein